MNSKRFIALTLIVFLLSFFTITSLAQGDTKQIALVIQFPDSVHTEIVTVPTDATTAQVLEAATIPVAMADFGFGPAVCNINGIGNPVDDCFADPEHYWAYYNLIDDNAWDSSMVGVGDYTPTDHSVEGFAWSGFDENFNPTVQPPVITFDEIENAKPFNLYLPSISKN